MNNIQKQNCRKPVSMWVSGGFSIFDFLEKSCIMNMYFRSTLRGIAMSKIEDFENQIVTFGMRDGDLDKYAKFLRYIHEDGLKQQHCYSTALRFPPERAEQAVTLIRFGLQNFESSWFSVYTSYLSMGSIYEKAENYVKAYEAYLSANEALGGEHHAYYENVLSSRLLWARLHMDTFRYSEETETYYRAFERSDEFSKSFLHQEFKCKVAQIVIFSHYGKYAEAKAALEAALEMCRPNFRGNLYGLLQKHRYTEVLPFTPEVARFLKRSQTYLS